MILSKCRVLFHLSTTSTNHPISQLPGNYISSYMLTLDSARDTGTGADTGKGTGTWYQSIRSNTNQNKTLALLPTKCKLNYLAISQEIGNVLGVLPAPLGVLQPVPLPIQ